MKILVVVNQKGGVGKTTLACHLALLGRDRGESTLLIDLDTQGNASGILSGDVTLAARTGGAETLFLDGLARPRSTRTGVDLFHGHQRLDVVDSLFDLGDSRKVGDRLRRLPYSVVVIDTPPAVGPRHLAPLIWADVAVTPLEPTAFGTQGLALRLETLPRIRALNEILEYRVAINRMVKTSGQQAAYVREIESVLETNSIPLLKPLLTQRVHVADAMDRGMPVWAYSRADRELRRTWKSFCEEAME